MLRDFSTYLVTVVRRNTPIANRWRKRVLPCIAVSVMHAVPMYLSVTLDDRREYSWVKMGENILSRCTNDVNRHVIRVTPLVDDSHLRLAGSHMARFASWCEREEVHMCWKTVWKASSVILAACSSGRKVGLFRPFRSLIDNCRAWLLPEERVLSVTVPLGSSG